MIHPNMPPLDRLPPQSIDAEQSLLGALMFGGDQAWDRIADVVVESDFYRDDHRRIFRVVRGLHEAGKAVDVLIVADSLTASNQEEQTGGLAYLAEIANSVASAANIRSYAEVVADKAKRRRLIAIAGDIEALAHGHQPVQEAIDQAGGALLDMTSKSRSAEPKHITEVVGRAIAEIETRIGKGEIFGRATGFADLDAMTGGMHAGDLIIVAGRPSMGKAQPLTSRVLMANGTWKTMEEIKFGDSVASVDGAASRVCGVFPQGEKQIYRVTLSDGRSARCCGEHLWKVRSSRWVERDQVKTTDALRELLKTERYRRRIGVPLVSGDFGEDINLPIDPWLLGALLSNAKMTSGAVVFSTADAATLARVQDLVGASLVKRAGDYEYRLNQGDRVESVKRALVSLGLFGTNSGTKFIPKSYLSASRKSRLALLCGFIDTDGWVEKFGSVRIALSNEMMANQVQQLVWSLGGRCAISQKTPTYAHAGEIKIGAASFVCNIQHADRSGLVSLKRKQRRCNDEMRFRWPTIVSIEPDGQEAAQCIQVTHPSHLYVTDDYTVTHNTALAINVAENVALDGGAVLVFSLEMSDTQIAMRNLAAIGSASIQRVRSGGMDDEEWDGITAAMGKLYDSKLYIDDAAGLSAAQMHARARRIKRQHGLDLVVIDYLQLMTADGNNRNEQLGDITRRVKLMARDLGVPVILLSQLSRKVEERSDRKPIMSDLRESGSIEQDADVILMVFREEYYFPDTPWKGMAELGLVKNRMGATGAVRLVFQGEFSRFRNADAGAIAEIARQSAESKPARRQRKGIAF